MARTRTKHMSKRLICILIFTEYAYKKVSICMGILSANSFMWCDILPQQSRLFITTNTCSAHQLEAFKLRLKNTRHARLFSHC